ncbi:hypothetical protein FB451DRAFT_1552929 [Mycena latifolia]|nr:hypothetical protein FB451DRAFT_1552929 [Mycena latifolia]
MPAPTRLRRIGLMERWHVTLHFLGLDSCVVSSAQYTTQDGSTLSKEVLFSALRTLIETHAALGLRFEGNEATSNVYLVRLPSVDLSRIVEFSGKSDLRQSFEGHLARQFETQGDLPLWRVEVLADNIVVFAVHHAIGDGMSSMAFHASLFRALRSGGHENASPIVQVPSTTPLLPPVDRVTNVRPSLGTIWRELAGLAPIAWRKSFRSAWSGHPVPPTPTSAVRVRFLSFSAAEVATFCTAWRAHKASLTSAVYVLAVYVLSRMLADDPVGYKRIATLVAVSMHGVAGVGDDVICDYPSSYHFLSPVATEFSWTEAARLARELQVLKTKARERIGLLALLFGRFVPYFEDHIGKKRDSGFALSNLGRFSTPAVEGKWTIGNTFFAQSDAGVGSAFSINLVGDPAGGLNISFGFGESNVDTPFIESFISLFEEELRSTILK